MPKYCKWINSLNPQSDPMKQAQFFPIMEKETEAQLRLSNLPSVKSQQMKRKYRNPGSPTLQPTLTTGYTTFVSPIIRYEFVTTRVFKNLQNTYSNFNYVNIFRNEDALVNHIYLIFVCLFYYTSPLLKNTQILLFFPKILLMI